MDENMTKLRHACPLTGEAGFTLVEMIVVTAVFVVVLIIAGDSFKTILTRASLLSKSSESNIEGIVGLEMFRHDINQAGFGLPWSFGGGITPVYEEAVDAPASNYNDKPSGIPRPFLAGNDLAAASAGDPDKIDYLVLKGTSLAVTNQSQRWTYVNYSSVGSSRPRIWSAENLSDNDRVIVLRRAFTETGYVNQLVSSGPSNFFTKFSRDGLSSGFAPSLPQETYYVYGVTGDQDPRMPFNRIDYYLKRPAGISSTCAENTGILYKALLNHSDGKFTEIPILDCVADMQVVFGWDLNDDGVADAYSNADGSTVNGGDTATVQTTMGNAELIRNRLKVVKVYLLVQDGRRDPAFSNTNPIVVGNESLGEKSITKEYTVANINDKKWTNFRWKVYRIVVTPKNLTLK